LLAFLSCFYVCITLFLSVINSFDLRYCICIYFTNLVYNVNKVYKALLVKAYPKFVAYFSYKKGQFSKIIKQYYNVTLTPKITETKVVVINKKSIKQVVC